LWFFLNHKYRPIKLVQTRHFSIEVSLSIQENERCLDFASVPTICDWILELFWQYGIFCFPFYYNIIKCIFYWSKLYFFFLYSNRLFIIWFFKSFLSWTGINGSQSYNIDHYLGPFFICIIKCIFYWSKYPNNKIIHNII
jgi:hypothetical protein